MATTTQTGAIPAARPAQADARRWWALAATSLGLFMALLDTTIVNVALPTIGTNLNASFEDLQWVINAYVLALAVFLVTAGRLGDIFGRKRVFMTGLVLFSLGSLGCGLASVVSLGGIAPIGILIGARAFQGIGGAVMMPLSMAIIAATFQGRERSAAFGINGAVIGLATAVGPLAGGLLVANVSWESIFYLNIPIGIVALLLTAWAVRESFDTRAPRSVDFFGLVTLSVSLFCLVLALLQANDADKGWTSPYILTLFALAALALIAFVAGELRLRNPMADPRLFLNRDFTGAAIVAFTLNGGLYALFFFLTLYLQNYLGFSALDAGLRFLPMSGLVLVSAPIAGAFGHKLGTRALIGAGMALIAVGVLLMGGITTASTPDSWIVLLLPFILGGLGSGLVNPVLADVAVGSVSHNRAGMASGLSSVCRQVGTAFGIAFLGALLTMQYNSGLETKVSALRVPNMPAAQATQMLDGIVSGLRSAGIFAASTGLKNPPAEYADFANQPLFPAVQQAVSESYIDGTVFILRVALVLLLLGLVAGIALIRYKPAEDEDAEDWAKEAAMAG